MKTLQEYYTTINSSKFEGVTADSVIKLLPQLSPSDEDFKNGSLERNAFLIQKSLDIKEDSESGRIRGLSWQFQGKKTDEQGKETNFYFPDVMTLTQQDYEYFERRFKECSGLFPKTEYGLLVYFGQKTPYSKRNEFKKELADKLMSLAQIYWDKALLGGEQNYNFQKYYPILRTAFTVYHDAKLTADRDTVCQKVIQLHADWDITRKDTLRGILDFTSLMAEYFSFFKTKIDFEDIIAKNLTAEKEIEKTYTWGAIYVLDSCIGIRQKLNANFKDLLRKKAELFEKMMYERSDSIACLQFIENALRIYQSLDDIVKIKEMENVYTTTRAAIKMNHENLFEFPAEVIQQRTQIIQEMVRNANDVTTITNIASDYWFSSIEVIQQMANNIDQQSLLASMTATKILDKYGNTIDKYTSKEEIQEMHFWQSFGISFQEGVTSLHEYIIEAYKAKKFTYANVLSYLESTWYNEPTVHTYHGVDIELRILDVLKPGLKKCFEELDYAFQDLTNNYYDYVIVVDSLTLKIETILRFMCERLGIATFKTRDKGGEKLVMEKLLDDMLSDLQDTPQKPTGFSETDRLMIKYSFTPKGHNLRNRVAHGLMDLWEYSFADIVILLYLIIKLSTYEFNSNTN